MTLAEDQSVGVGEVEALMLDKYRAEPFHNLYLLHRAQPPWPLDYGGTCSDKTLSFLNAARRAGINASLHSGYIGGREIHRLARVVIGAQTFFADVGNGWPALRLYPLSREIDYVCFGMRFRTELHHDRLVVYHSRNGVESLQLEIEYEGRPEHELMADIASRFSRGIHYPFSTSVRFARIVGERFLFLRGDRLEIYGHDTFSVVEGIGADQVPNVLRDAFEFDIRQVLSPGHQAGSTVGQP